MLAQAVQELFPGTKLGIGPPVENGFYYDFEPERPFTPEDLTALEKKMQEIVRAGQNFARREISDADAKAELAHEPYKLELIGLKGGGADDTEGASVEVGGAQLTMYDNLDARTGDRVWTDLCRGPHLPRTSTIPAFTLTRSRRRLLAGQREEPAAAAHLRHRLGEQGRPQGLPGAAGRGRAPRPPAAGRRAGPVQLPRRDRLRPGRLPPQGRRHQAGDGGLRPPPAHRGGLRLRRHPAHHQGARLFETSGHLPYYADTMFPPMELENAQYYLKAMNCPMHNLIFRSRGRSYRELPLRFFEFGTVYRYEKSGVVHGLTRVRGLTQDDSHSYVTPEQAPGEIRHLLRLRARPAARLRPRRLLPGAVDPRRRPGKQDKFIGSEEEWAVATAVLEEAAKETGLELVPDPGGAAFYGPKISVQARDAIGRTWQMSTIQYDFNQPARFGLEYTAADGSRQQPVMIHSAKFGSIERFFGVLTEHYAGRVPGLARPGAGRRHPDHRRAGALPDRRRAAADGEGRPGRDRRLRRPDAEEDPHQQQAEDPVRAARRRHRRRGGRGLLPLPRRVAAQRRPGRRGGRPDRRLDRRPPQRRSRRPRESRRPPDERGAAGGLPGRRLLGRRRDRRRSSSTCGRRTGWPTSAARASRPASTTARSA